MKMNRVEDAKKVMEEALPLGSMVEVYIYGRTMLEMGQKEEGMKVHKLNYDRHPNEFFTNVGMGRAWSAMGDYKKALSYMKAALPMAPSAMNKTRVEGMIKTLQEGKDVN
jgi:tetratricopeptide (TPR) repeat protein